MDQMDDFTNFGQALDASMAAQIKRILGLDDGSMTSSDLEILVRGLISNGKVSNLQVRLKSPIFKNKIKKMHLFIFNPGQFLFPGNGSVLTPSGSCYERLGLKCFKCFFSYPSLPVINESIKNMTQIFKRK